MRKVLLILFIFILTGAFHSFGRAEEAIKVINITGKIITSDDGDVPGRLEETLFGDKKEYSPELKGKEEYNAWKMDYNQEITVYEKKYLFAVYRGGDAEALIVYREKSGKMLREGG